MIFSKLERLAVNIRKSVSDVLVRNMSRDACTAPQLPCCCLCPSPCHVCRLHEFQNNSPTNSFPTARHAVRNLRYAVNDIYHRYSRPLRTQSDLSIASAELQSAFQSLLTTPSHRGLLATIKDEKIEPLDFIPAGSSFLSDLSTLAPHLDPKTPLYVLLRRPDDLSSSTPNSCVAVTYVPQSSHVRLKTLFASTRLSLVRELGGEHFADSIFVTEAHELSEQGWRAYEAHDDAAQPLTREEQDLEGIKEAEASERGGTGARRGHVDSGFAIKVADEVQEALVALKNGGGDNLVQLVRFQHSFLIYSNHLAPN